MSRVKSLRMALFYASQLSGNVTQLEMGHSLKSYFRDINKILTLKGRCEWSNFDMLNEHLKNCNLKLLCLEIFTSNETNF